MAAAQQPQKITRRSLGQPVQWSDEELTALAQVGPADVKAAARLWENDAPRWAKSLLEAQAIERKQR